MQLVPLGELGVKDIVVGTIIVTYVGLIVDTIIAALAWQVRETLSDTKFIRKINLVTSIGFILIGAFLIFSLITNFDGAFAL